MFSNAGAKLKVIAIIFFVLVVIASVVLAFVFGWSKEETHDRYKGTQTKTVFHPLPFFLLLLGGPLFAYFSSLLIYGFGCIVDHYDVGSFKGVYKY